MLAATASSAAAAVSWDSTTANTLTASSTSTSPTLATWLRRAARTSDRVLAAVLPALPAAASNAVLVAILVLTVGDLTTDVGSCSSSADALAHIESERIIHLIVSTAMLAASGTTTAVLLHPMSGIWGGHGGWQRRRWRGHSE